MLQSDQVQNLKLILLIITESEQGDEAKHKKVENPKTLEPSTPDYAAGLAPVAQPNKVSLTCNIF